MRVARATAVAALLTLALAAPAAATPVCTDGYKGGPPAALCGGRIFPEAELARGYIQYTPDPFGFIEYQHGIEYLAQKYPRWISVFKLSDLYGDDAVSAGPDAAALLRGRGRRRRARHPGHQDHRPQGARRGQGDAPLLAVGARQRARRARGRRAHGRGPRDRRRARAARSWTASTTTSPRPAASRSSTSTTSRTCWRRRPSTSRLQRRRLGGRRLVEPAGAVHLHARELARHRPQPADADGRADQRGPQPAPGERDEVRHPVHARGGRGRPGRQDGLRRRHPRRAELAGLHGHHVPGGRVRLGRPPAPDGDRRADQVGDRRHAVRGHRRGDRERERRQRRRVRAARSRSSPRTGRPSGTRSATPTPASSATTWPPTSASPGWTTRSCSTTRSRRRRGTSTSRRTTSTPAGGSSRPRWRTRSPRRRSSTPERRGRPGRARRLRGRTRTRSPTRTRTGRARCPVPRRTGSARTASRSSSAPTASRTRSGSATRTG